MHYGDVQMPCTLPRDRHLPFLPAHRNLFFPSRRGRAPFGQDPKGRGVLSSAHRRLAAQVPALSGMPGHVHPVVPGSHNDQPCQLMQQVKGVSSTFARDLTDNPFGWQDNYGEFNISKWHVRSVVRYVENEKRRH